MNRLLAVVLACGVFLSVVPVRAEGWGMPNLNPFGAKKSPTSSKSASSNPSWMPGAHKKPANTFTNPGGSSVWQSVKKAPSSMMSGTQKAMSAMNPFKSASQPTTFGSSAKKEKKSWFPSWGSGESKQSGPPSTVSDFIAGPRPE